MPKKKASIHTKLANLISKKTVAPIETSTLNSQQKPKLLGGSGRGRKAALRKKRQSILSENRSKKQQQSEQNKNAFITQSPEPYEPPKLRSDVHPETNTKYHNNHIINMQMLSNGLRCCRKCKKGPLSLDNIVGEPRKQGLGVTIKIACKFCNTENMIRPNTTHRTGSRGPPTIDVNTRMGLAMLHTGVGPTHVKGSLAILGVSPPTTTTVKKREREVGAVLENVAKKSCLNYLGKEKESSVQQGEKASDDGSLPISGSFDGAWSKRGKSRNSHTGFGTVIGEATKKVITYGNTSTICRTCQVAERSNQPPKPHDCRKNHKGSAKSMEPEIAVDLFTSTPHYGARITRYTGDEDTTTESHINCRVPYEVEKWSDIQHARRNFGAKLYNVR